LMQRFGKAQSRFISPALPVGQVRFPKDDCAGRGVIVNASPVCAGLPAVEDGGLLLRKGGRGDADKGLHSRD
jgi:hypothetical protein